LPIYDYQKEFYGFLNHNNYILEKANNKLFINVRYGIFEVINIKALVKIDLNPNVKRLPVQKLLLGHFIEHLGRCIENGIWMYKETKRPLLKEFPLERIPSDLFQVMNALSPPIIRWPGGSFSDTYHWKDGIGPRAKRPKRRNRAWGGPIKSFFCNLGPNERNHFGTDEFLALCEKLNAEAYININFGSGTVQEAADWVEYTNTKEATNWGAIRAENGHKEPYNVKYWGIANEIYGWHEVGYCKTAQKYAKRYIEFAKAMRRIDPNIKLVGVGCHKSDWNRTFLEMTKGYVDYLSVHIYLPIINPILNVIRRNPLPANEKVYYSIVNSAYNVEELIADTEQDIISVLGINGLDSCKIALDEWNIWYHLSQIYRADKPPYVLRDGIWSACVINALIRNAHSVGMANFAQMVNCIGMILTYDHIIVKNPHYYVFKMYGDAWQPNLLKTEVKSPLISSKKFGYNIPARKKPVLDIEAAISDAGDSISIFCVNKHFKEPIIAEIHFVGDENLKLASKVEISELHHDNPFITNTKKIPNNINLINRTVNDGKNPYIYELPPHSVTTLQFRLD